MRKNAGLFFAQDLYQGWSIAQVEEAFDELWVCGPIPAPGSCDPTYAIYKMLSNTLRAYSNVQNAKPVLAGYYWLPYTTIYDYEIMGNNVTHVH
jgi:hypothetical protein